MTEAEKKVYSRIPKYLQKHITDFHIEYNVDYDEKSGKFLNRYYVTFDGEERFFNSFNFMLWKLKEDM